MITAFVIGLIAGANVGAIILACFVINRTAEPLGLPIRLGQLTARGMLWGNLSPCRHFL